MTPEIRNNVTFKCLDTLSVIFPSSINRLQTNSLSFTVSNPWMNTSFTRLRVNYLSFECESVVKITWSKGPASLYCPTDLITTSRNQRIILLNSLNFLWPPQGGGLYTWIKSYSGYRTLKYLEDVLRLYVTTLDNQIWYYTVYKRHFLVSNF